MAATARKTVLVVEDEQDVREAFAMALEDEGLLVLQAATAEAGLALLHAHRIDLVLSDYALPGQNGCWMLAEALKLGLLQTDPLVITAHPNPADAAGFKVLQKPVDLEVLLTEVRARLAPPRATKLPEPRLSVSFAVAAVEAAAVLSAAQRQVVERIAERAAAEALALQLAAGLHQRTESGVNVVYRLDLRDRRVVVISVRPA